MCISMLSSDAVIGDTCMPKNKKKQPQDLHGTMRHSEDRSVSS